METESEKSGFSQGGGGVETPKNCSEIIILQILSSTKKST